MERAPAWQRYGDILALLGALVLLWWVLARLAGPDAMTGPAETLRRASELLESRRFHAHMRESLLALGYALLLAALGGLALGTWLGVRRLAGQVAEPILVALYALPKITLYPVILLIFGLGLPAKVAFGAIHGIIPVTIFTLNAVRTIRPVYLKVARTLRLTPWQAFFTVWLPAALPEIVSGQRVGFALTLLGVLIGEMFASQRGVGFVLINAIGLNDVPTIMAAAFLLAGFAATVSAILLKIDRALHRRTVRA